jgi:hypothetical protein
MVSLEELENKFEVNDLASDLQIDIGVAEDLIELKNVLGDLSPAIAVELESSQVFDDGASDGKGIRNLLVGALVVTGANVIGGLPSGGGTQTGGTNDPIKGNLAGVLNGVVAGLGGGSDAASWVNAAIRI